ncbi:MAG: hypothetical protein KAV99_01775 [Candidatus Latescibacteria bacterium]|nr:hypothetical protein [Candidatus Latescibacterota bacterium]
MSSTSDGNLEKALKVRFPDEEVKCVAKLLSEVSEKGRIAHEQIELSEDAKEDVVLFTYTNRFLLPTRSGKTMAWEDRPLILAPDECYRMPIVVAEVVRWAQETGRWDRGPLFSGISQNVVTRRPAIS